MSGWVGCGVVCEGVGVGDLEVAFNASTSAVTEFKLPLTVLKSALTAFIVSGHLCKPCHDRSVIGRICLVSEIHLASRSTGHSDYRQAY